MRRAVVTVLTALVAFVGVGCGDDDSGSDEPAGSTTTAPSAGSTITTGSVVPAEPDVVTVVSQNLLHGLACAPDSNGCDLPARVSLFLRQLDDAGCPAIVSVQEANQQMVDLLSGGIPEICDGAYGIEWDGDEGIDREVVLTTAEVVDSRRLPVPGGFRTAYWVRLVTDGALVDLVSTHLASGSDDRPCDVDTCPPPCLPDDRLNVCQARTMLEAVEELAHPNATVVIAGDLNAEPGSPTLAAIDGAGFVDAHVAAGRPECNATTGVSCTGGRDDATLDDMTDPASLQRVRIDFVLVRDGGPCTISDGGLFNGEPATGDPAGLAHPSDHTAVFAALECVTPGDVDITGATLPPTTTTTPPEGGGPADPDTVAAVTEAYTSLFGGAESDPEVKLTHLESADALRPFFLESFEANQAIASQISVRVDGVVLGGPGEAVVVFALMLEEAVVVGPQEGQAVLVDGRWLVSRRTYCDLSAAGAEELPEPCR